MLNGWAMLLGILCVLFVVSVELNQPVQPDSHIITVTKEIDVAKLNENVDGLNKSMQDLTKTIGKLDKSVSTLSTTVGKLEKTVTRLDERTGIMLNLQYVILAGIIGGPLVTILVYRRFSRDNKNVDMVDAQTYHSGRDIPVPREISSKDEYIDDLQSNYHASREKV